MSADIEYRLQRARVLVELGWLPEAEVEIASALDESPAHLDALSLCAKIKHIKGELSQTIACWAQIHEQTRQRGPQRPGVFWHDASVVPSRGPSQMSLAGAELERALGMFQQGHVPQARAWCAAVALRHRGTNAAVYKLAVIAEAWFAEMSGDLASARALLERLGRERGFEHDLARLEALVRVYDQLGTVDALEAGAKICRHVLGEAERTGREKLSILGQLAVLERRLGNLEAATELDANFVEATRRRMHRATLVDLATVAAGEYLPIAELRRVRPANDRAPASLDRRARALVHAIHGEPEPARTLMTMGNDVLDRCYVAELAALDGDDDIAIELFLAAIDDGVDDARILGWLLDRHASSASPAIARQLGEPARLERARRVLETTCKLAPQRPEPWRHLAILHGIADRVGDATRCLTRATGLTVARESRIGRVLAASVYHLAGKPKGLLHEIWVHRTPTTPGRGGTLGADDIHGNVTAELRASVRNTFVAVREYVRARLPEATADLDDFTYSYKLPKEDEQSGGLSAGLPSALAFLSVFLQRPVASTIASSGALITEAHDVITIGRIGEAEYKVRAAYHGNLRSLILPLANRAELDRSTLVPRALTAELVRHAANLEQAMLIAFGPDVFTRG